MKIICLLEFNLYINTYYLAMQTERVYYIDNKDLSINTRVNIYKKYYGCGNNPTTGEIGIQISYKNDNLKFIDMNDGCAFNSGTIENTQYYSGQITNIYKYPFVNIYKISTNIVFEYSGCIEDDIDQVTYIFEEISIYSKVEYLNIMFRLYPKKTLYLDEEKISEESVLLNNNTIIFKKNNVLNYLNINNKYFVSSNCFDKIILTENKRCQLASFCWI